MTATVAQPARRQASHRRPPRYRWVWPSALIGLPLLFVVAAAFGWWLS